MKEECGSVDGENGEEEVGSCAGGWQVESINWGGGRKREEIIYGCKLKGGLHSPHKMTIMRGEGGMYV